MPCTQHARPSLRRLAPVALALLLLLGGTAASAAPLVGGPASTGGPFAPRVVRAAAPLGLLSGPDVSSHQHGGGTAVGWGRVAASGRSFAIVKATEGGGYTNPYFVRDWAGVRSAGLVRAAYHYARPALPLSTAVDQARRFVATVAPTAEQGTLPLVLDMEEAGRLGPASLQAWTASFLQTVERLTGRTPLIYTYPWFWDHQMGGSTAFTRYPLWIASYNPYPPRTLPGGWPTWTLWQYTYRGVVRGVSGQVDLSVFGGTTEALLALADSTASPISERWAGLDGAAGLLGSPLGPERAVAGGRVRDFAGGSIYWSRSTSARVLSGAVLARYAALGGPGSLLGFPLTDAVPVPGAPGATHAVFPGGRLYAGPADEVAWLLPNGPVLADWLARGSVTSSLGLPVGDVVPVTGGTGGVFAGGQLLSSHDRGTHELHGGVLGAWLAAGGADSSYGLPSSDTVTVSPGLVRAEFGTATITTGG